MYSNVGTLTSAAISFTENTHGTAASMTVSFDTSTEFPVNGKVRLTFPGVFVTEDTFVGTGIQAVSGFADGTSSLSFAGVVATIEWTANSAISAGTTISITLNDVTIPPATGNLDSYTISIFDDDEFISETIIVSQPALFLADALITATALPSVYSTGTSITIVIQFTTANAIPPDGRIKVDFSTEFQDIPSSTTLSAVTGIPGTTVHGMSSNVLTIDRQNDGAGIDAGTVISFTLSGFENPGSVKTISPATVSTLSNGGWIIDTLAATDWDTVTSDMSSWTCVPNTKTAGSAVEITFTAQNVNPIPADGIIVLGFPTLLDSIFNTVTLQSTNLDGSLTLTKTTNVLTMTRTGGSSWSSGEFNIVLDGMTLPSGSVNWNFVDFYTTNVNGEKLDAASTLPGFTSQPVGKSFMIQ